MKEYIELHALTLQNKKKKKNNFAMNVAHGALEPAWLYVLKALIVPDKAASTHTVNDELNGCEK